tara:strand:- start:2836 stop:3690 length:855 start_codon:yes stop_codon:yes gene_type:complete
MNIALTGSSGSIGSILVNDLKISGYNVICISSSNSLHKENIFSYEEVISRKINYKVDLILHLASINSNLDESQIDEELNLCKSVFKVMEVMECKNLIFFSSIKVYGENSFDIQQFTEDSALDPKSAYGLAKKKCENLIAEMSSISNFNYVVLRLPPLIIEHSMSNLAKLFFVVKKGIPIPSFKVADKNERSFLSYKLLLSSIKILIGDKTKINDEIFNLADEKAISTNDLLKKIGIQINKEPKIIYLPDFIFKQMIKLNGLQLILCQLYGNFNISSEKFKNTFL